ncbi:MAG: ribosome recycling factor [Alphaproteobacteria bacterium]|nr:ribosome recycling factor [Alphaproteobacteria bacterium]NDG05093.1 ribosome recycling factor [Alphaproteobacteria bacterium]
MSQAEFAKRMDGAIDALKKDFAGLRTGRASPNLLDPVMVDAYGSIMPLSQVATVSVPEPRLLSVQVWDKGMVKAVEKGIADANLGLNPQADGQTVRVRIPDLTTERRAELVKVAHKYAETARVAVRNVRRDGMEALKGQKKNGQLSEDALKKEETAMQKLTDDHIKKIDDMLAAKEKEVMTV